jgi:hypothetical protein
VSYHTKPGAAQEENSRPAPAVESSVTDDHVASDVELCFMCDENPVCMDAKFSRCLHEGNACMNCHVGYLHSQILDDGKNLAQLRCGSSGCEAAPMYRDLSACDAAVKAQLKADPLPAKSAVSLPAESAVSQPVACCECGFEIAAHAGGQSFMTCRSCGVDMCITHTCGAAKKEFISDSRSFRRSYCCKKGEAMARLREDHEKALKDERMQVRPSYLSVFNYYFVTCQS